MTGYSPPADAALSQSGGSMAGQAYRAELELQRRSSGIPSPQASAGPEAKAAPGAAVGEARAAERKKVNGRASVVCSGSGAVTGKMIDISLTGACILMEDALSGKQVCTLDFDIFHGGKRYAFSVPAVSVYSVLASGKGFKVGFQFGPRGPAAQSAIASLVA